MKGIMALVERYDREREELKAEVLQLKAANARLTDQLVSYTQTVDKMKLDLIMSGALTKPKE